MTVEFETILKILIVGSIAANPFGELLIAYPAGLALGLDPLTAILASIIFNLLPIPFLLFSSKFVLNKLKRLKIWIEKRSKAYEKIIKRIGFVSFIILTPFVGVYVTSISMKLLGYRNIHAFCLQTTSLIIYSILLYHLTFSLFEAFIPNI